MSSEELSLKKLKESYSSCSLCPRCCQADRYQQAGFCGAGTEPKLARVMLHMWEEPCLTGNPEVTGRSGAGAIFFSHCTLRCVFCQNHQISAEGFGKEVSVEKLAEIMLRLQDQGAANIDLVTADHYIPSVAAALDRIKDRLSIPVVFNCSGYETIGALKQLDGYIDIYLPDLKYYDSGLALKYSLAPHYFETALTAVKEMLRQTGKPLFRSDELVRGTIIRHMVLPGCRKDSIALLDQVAKHLNKDEFLISLMSQYTPFFRAEEFPEINRRLTSFEYESVVQHAAKLGLEGYMQEKSSAKEEYTPSFDLEGVY